MTLNPGWIQEREREYYYLLLLFHDVLTSDLSFLLPSPPFFYRAILVLKINCPVLFSILPFFAICVEKRNGGKRNFRKKFRSDSNIEKLIRCYSKRMRDRFFRKKGEKKNTANKIHNSKNKRCKCQRDIEIKIENEIRESDFYFPNN